MNLKRLSLLAIGLSVVCHQLPAAEETAPFEVVEKSGKFEIREYPVLKVAATSTSEGDKRSADRRFMKLFRYISGDNETGEKIAMTTPVFMNEADGENTMSFVLPAAVAKAGAPAPVAEDVKVVEMSGGKFAVFRFSGLRSDALEKSSLEKLNRWMEEKGLEPVGKEMFAYYNPPWIPGFMRRNEVLVPIR